MKITDSINNNVTHMELDRRFNDPKDPTVFTTAATILILLSMAYL